MYLRICIKHAMHTGPLYTGTVLTLSINKDADLLLQPRQQGPEGRRNRGLWGFGHDLRLSSKASEENTPMF